MNCEWMREKTELPDDNLQKSPMPDLNSEYRWSSEWLLAILHGFLTLSFIAAQCSNEWAT